MKERAQNRLLSIDTLQEKGHQGPQLSHGGIFRHSPIRKMHMELDQKLALFEEMLQSQNFLGQADQRALKKSLRQQHFKSLFFLEERKHTNARTSSEPSSPKSSIQFLNSQTNLDISQFQLETQPNYQNNQYIVPQTSMLSTTMSDTKIMRFNPRNFNQIQSQGMINNSERLEGESFMRGNLGTSFQEQMTRTLNQVNEDENKFLLHLKSEIMNLKKRLKLEIMQKMQLIKQINQHKRKLTMPHAFTEDKGIQVECEELEREKFFLDEDLEEKSVYQNVSIINEDQINMDDHHLQNHHNNQIHNREAFAINIIPPAPRETQHQKQFSLQLDISRVHQATEKELLQVDQKKEHEATMAKLSNSFVQLSQRFNQIYTNKGMRKQSENSDSNTSFQPRDLQIEEYNLEDILKDLPDFSHKRQKSSSFQEVDYGRVRGTSEKVHYPPIISHRELVPGRAGHDLEKLLYDGKYWKNKFDVLLKEKKQWHEDNQKTRQQLNTIQNENKILKDKIKHLVKVVEVFRLKDDESFQSASLQNHSNQTPLRQSVQLNESFSEEGRSGSGFFPMLFKSDRWLKEEQDSSDDNSQIAIDLRETYVEQEQYEEQNNKQTKKGSIFRKKKTKKDKLDEALINEGLFIIAEEPPSFSERASFNNRSSTNLNEIGQSSKKSHKKKSKWIELKEMDKF